MKQGLVSVITPCYNGAKYISETIESVIAQTYAKWEMIIIDDGSKDNSVEIARNYAKQDSRIQLITQENAGSAAARNNGIRRAEGQYIALLDADDLWDTTFLEKQIAYMKEKDAVCVCCSYRRIDDKSREILHPLKVKPTITYKDMMVMNRIGCLSGLYDTAKYGKVYLREELKSIRDDYAYWLDIVKLEGIAVGNPEVLASYRILPDSTTGNKKRLIKKQFVFYHDYLKFGAIHSWINVFRWGVAGVIKFSR
ncbi:MAG: glycosyltransferase family 2 protein [Roseburia sp.]|nr:glycosyltransferase family 2 protein [Roseburia sp.]